MVLNDIHIISYDIVYLAVDSGQGVVCQCEPCLAKKTRLEQNKPKTWMATTAR